MFQLREPQIVIVDPILMAHVESAGGLSIASSGFDVADEWVEFTMELITSDHVGGHPLARLSP
jgi:hypothetical protein